MHLDELHIAFSRLAQDTHSAFVAEERTRDEMERLARLWVALAAPVDAIAAMRSSLDGMDWRFMTEAENGLDRLRVLVWDAMVVAAASSNALFCESEDDMLDEAARARFPETHSSALLAELRLGLLPEDTMREDDTERRAVGRRLGRIEARIEPLVEPCRKELVAGIDVELAAVDPQSDSAAELKSLRARLLDPVDPCVRLAAKRWFNFLTMVAAGMCAASGPRR